MSYKNGKALGMIETKGLVPLIAAADAAAKTAQIKIVAYEKIGSALVSVLFRGDVAACHSAVKAGVEAVLAVNKEALFGTHVIPEPHEDLQPIFPIQASE